MRVDCDQRLNLYYLSSQAKQFLKSIIWGLSDSTVDKVIALYKANLGSMPYIPYSPPNPTRNESWAPPDVVYTPPPQTSTLPKHKKY